jgi:hypothetical protein
MLLCRPTDSVLTCVIKQFVEVVGLLAGYEIGYACGDMTRLIEDIQLLKPHVSLITASCSIVTNVLCIDHGRCTSCAQSVLPSH